MTIGELATLAGTGLAIAVALVGAAYTFGRLTQRVAQVENQIGELRSEMRKGFGELQAQQLEQTERILAALGNHRHDTDGNTVFTIPQA